MSSCSPHHIGLVTLAERESCQSVGTLIQDASLCASCLSMSLLDSLINVCKDISNVFNTNRKTNKLWCHPRCNLLLRVQLAVRCCGWVNAKRLGITNIADIL